MSWRWVVVLTSGLFMACASAPATGGSALPSEMTAALREGRVLRTRLYLDDAGHLVKTAFYVEAASLPRWVLDEVERITGVGADPSDEYELEFYADVGTVYEVKRQVGGRAVELAFKADRALHYREAEVARAELPGPIEATIAAAEAQGKSFKTAFRRTESGRPDLLQVKLMAGDRQHRLWFSAEGVLISRSVEAPGKLEITGAPE